MSASQCLACRFKADTCEYEKGGFCAGCRERTMLFHVGIDTWACSETCAEVERKRRDETTLTAQDIAAWLRRQPAGAALADEIVRRKWREK